MTRYTELLDKENDRGTQVAFRSITTLDNYKLMIEKNRATLWRIEESKEKLYKKKITYYIVKSEDAFFLKALEADEFKKIEFDPTTRLETYFEVNEKKMFTYLKKNRVGTIPHKVDGKDVPSLLTAAIDLENGDVDSELERISKPFDTSSRPSQSSFPESSLSSAFRLPIIGMGMVVGMVVGCIKGGLFGGVIGAVAGGMVVAAATYYVDNSRPSTSNERSTVSILPSTDHQGAEAGVIYE